MAALRAAEEMRSTTLIGRVFDVPADMLLGRQFDDLWVTPITLEHTEEHWPRCDIEPRHPYRRDGNQWTAREYRAMCRRWRREHRAWRRRQPLPPTVMVVIRAEARAVCRDGVVRKFGHTQTLTRDLFITEPAIVELVKTRMIRELRAALVRHWEET